LSSSNPNPSKFLGLLYYKEFWLDPIILAIWDVEIRRIIVEGQNWQKVHETLILTNGWLLRDTFVIRAMQMA
jgi:hypothetical protein